MVPNATQLKVGIDLALRSIRARIPLFGERFEEDPKTFAQLVTAWSLSLKLEAAKVLGTMDLEAA